MYHISFDSQYSTDIESEATKPKKAGLLLCEKCSSGCNLSLSCHLFWPDSGRVATKLRYDFTKAFLVATCSFKFTVDALQLPPQKKHLVTFTSDSGKRNGTGVSLGLGSRFGVRRRGGEGQNVQRCEDAVGTHTSLMAEGWVERYMRYEDKIPYQFMSDQAWLGRCQFSDEPFWNHSNGSNESYYCSTAI